MSAEWQIVRIGDLGKVITGKTPSTAVSENFGGNYPFITIPDLDGRREITASSRSLSELGAQAMRSCRLPVGAVMMSCIATIGKCGITTKASFTNQQINSLICGDGVDPKFVYYIFSQLGRALEAAGGGGSVYTNVSKSRFESIEIKLPSLHTQKSIAEILGKLDDKIDLNRRINQTLEAMAQAIFKSWFVDFDPVKAKIAAKTEGRDPLRAAMTAISGKPDTELETLPLDQFATLAASAALFPDEMEASELGVIPKGWYTSTLGEQCSYLNRGISPNYIDEGGVLVLNQKCIRDFSLDPSKGRRHDPTQRNVSGRELQMGDVLVNSTGVGTLGRVAQVLRLDEPTIVDSHVTTVRSGPNLNSAYLGQWFVMKQPDIEAMGEGSTGQTELSRGKLAAMMLLVPDLALLGAFAAALSPMQSLMSTRNRESLMLQETRDALLPRLLSGELKLSNVLEGAKA